MKKYKIVLLSFVTLLVISSCKKDFFELKSPPESPWTTLAEFDRAAIGAYNALFIGGEWNNPLVNLIIPKMSSGDDMDWINYPEPGFLRKTKEYMRYLDEYNSGGGNGAFYQLYKVIGAANDGLAFVETNPYPTLSALDKTNNFDRITGELLFMRGYSYYLLETTFGHAYVPGGPNDTKDIPLRTTYPIGTSDAKNPKIGTTEEVYAQIIEDLKKAKALLPAKYDPATMPASYQVRANKFAAAGMLMRAYFQRGNYDSAKLEADFIIDQNNGEYDLSEDPIQAWNKSAVARGKETIFYIPMYDLSNGGGTNHLTFFNAFDPAPDPVEPKVTTEMHMAKSTILRLGWMANPQTNDTVLSIKARADKRFQQLLVLAYPADKHKPGQVYYGRENILTNVTSIWTYKYWRGPKVKQTNIPVLRLAEVYLTRAICRFRLNDLAGAAADLNVVRERAWDETFGGPYVPVTSATITEDMINDERVIEMFGENDRIDYLRGLKVPIPKGERGTGTDPYTSEDFVWAIPFDELLYNESYH
jgi:hypothetical protein